MCAKTPGRSPILSNPLRWALMAMAGVALVLTLAWNDVLPGGWTLRGWVEPHAHREARVRRQHSDERLELFAEWNRSAPADSIVFAGSSTIERFPLETLFPGSATQNRGIGDETCAEFQDRLEGSRPFAPPAMWVLYLGSLDFRRLEAPPEVVVDRVERAMGAVRGSDPELPLVLIGILPEQSMPDPMVQRLAATNAGLATLCGRMGVTFVDTARAPLTNPAGSLSAELATDRWHLSGEGYGILAEWLLEASPALRAHLRVK